jgi:hypothetical protein
MNKIKVLHETESPEFSIVTPLRIGDSVSKTTLDSVFSCEAPFNWISVESKNNVMKNFEIGFYELLDSKRLAPNVIKIDNDTEWSEGTLEEMSFVLSNSVINVAYSYCSFQYKGHINSQFPAINFNPEKLKQGNYISSNSMFKSNVIQEIGLVTDSQYVRLLDWAFLLKCLRAGYIGKPSAGFFTAYSSKDSVSSGSIENYNLKRDRVVKDFGEF